MHEVLKKVEQFGVVPVIKIEDANDAVPLAKAMCEGGLPCAAVTLTPSCSWSPLPATAAGSTCRT